MYILLPRQRIFTDTRIMAEEADNTPALILMQSDTILFVWSNIRRVGLGTRLVRTRPVLSPPPSPPVSGPPDFRRTFAPFIHLLSPSLSLSGKVCTNQTIPPLLDDGGVSHCVGAVLSALRLLVDTVRHGR